MHKTITASTPAQQKALHAEPRAEPSAVIDKACLFDLLSVPAHLIWDRPRALKLFRLPLLSYMVLPALLLMLMPPVVLLLIS